MSKLSEKQKRNLCGGCGGCLDCLRIERSQPEPHISEVRYSEHELEFEEDYPINGPCC